MHEDEVETRQIVGTLLLIKPIINGSGVIESIRFCGSLMNLQPESIERKHN